MSSNRGSGLLPWAGGGTCILLATLMVGCGRSSTEAGTLTTANETSISLRSSLWYGVGLVGPPLTTSCQSGGAAVAIRGAFGPEAATIQLRGLHAGRRYSFVEYRPAPSATVSVTETGPVAPQLGVSSHTDVLGPVSGLQGLLGEGSGVLSVSSSGRSGSLQVSLAKGDTVSGHWVCGSRRTSGPSSRPELLGARVPPVVGECSIGSQSSTSPPPITCANGDLNIESWFPDKYVSAAGRGASLHKVEGDLCKEQGEESLTPAELVYDYSVAAVYYGWDFHLTAAQVIAADGCSG